MPIRFYCVTCEKLLGIATRKAGQIVSCPACKTQLRVPIPETPSPKPTAEASSELNSPTENPMVPATVGKAFEESNFDQILKDDQDEPTVQPEAPVVRLGGGLGMGPAVVLNQAATVRDDDVGAYPHALPPVELPEHGDVPVGVGMDESDMPRQSSGRVGRVILTLILMAASLVGGFFLGRAEFLQGWP